MKFKIVKAARNAVLSLAMVLMMTGTLLTLPPGIAHAQTDVIDLSQTITNSKTRPDGIAYPGDTMTVRLSMDNYGGFASDIDVMQLETYLNPDTVEYVDGSAKSLVTDTWALVNQPGFTKSRNALFYGYVAGADHKLPHTNSDLVTFQLKVKEGVADGTPLSLSILSSSYISENKTTNIDYSFDAQNMTIKEFKPLTVKNEPTKITYIEGQDLDLTGGMLTYTNAEGESSDISMTDSQVTVTGYNKTPDSYGEPTITLTLNGESTTIKVIVEEKL
ncbi:bacterial Ig-like domain-containing protein [Eubacterium aggregans]|uniref:bacterial Ig-like domain-containing protein n=1 Tax=Eubacterium aggregans TaxID=81409 RepID=UPI003F367174